MVRRIILKRLRAGGLAALLLASLAQRADPARAVELNPRVAAQAQPKLPVLRNLGLVPLVWERRAELSSAEQEQAKILDKDYRAAFRAAQRFHVINDEIIAELWDSADGRIELESNFELDAFASLVVYPEADTLTLVVRLMSSNLKSYLLESERIGRQNFSIATPEARQDLIESLVFRLLNRLPVDLSVTSIQDRYVTLSAGAEQGLRAEDRLTFYRSRISQVHPANGSWLSFANKKLGTATVLDVKSRSAVAVIESMSYEDALEIGDGARIEGSESRLKFRRLAQKPTFHDADDGSPILLGGPAPLPAKSVIPVASPAPSPAASPEPTPSPSPTVSDPAELPPALPPTDTGPSRSFLEQVGEYAEHGYVATGIRSWSASGSASAASKLPAWILNHGEIGLARTFGLIAADVAMNLDYGPTRRGSFMGFGLAGAARWQMPVNLRGGTLSAGGFGRYYSFGVNKEGFGGANVITLGPTARLNGALNPAEVGMSLDYMAELRLILLGAGSAGIKGADRAINSMSGFALYAEAVRLGAPKAIAWGAYFSFEQEAAKLSSGSSKVSTVSLGLLGRYRF